MGADVGGSVCVGKLEHFTGHRGMSMGGALLPQTLLIKDNLKSDLPYRPQAAASLTSCMTR